VAHLIPALEADQYGEHDQRLRARGRNIGLNANRPVAIKIAHHGLCLALAMA
jgi:hypothetical protein